MDSFRQSFLGHDDAWEYFVEAYRLQMRGRIGEAARAYSRSIKLHPTAEALTFLGWALSFLGQHEEAIEYCKKAIATDPDFGNPYNDIGSYLIHLGRPAEAIEWLEKATRAPRYEAPQFPCVNLGTAYEALGETMKAIESYKRALAIQPDHDLARARLIHLIGETN